MTVSQMYSFSTDALVDLLAAYADWLADDAAGRADDEGMLETARRFLDWWQPMASYVEEPGFVGHCAYCGQAMYAMQALYKHRYEDQWLWVCPTCASMLWDAVPAVPGDDVRESIPRWKQ